MKIEPIGKHYVYEISDFNEKEFPINYDKRRFPRGFDMINIDCYGDGSLRNMFLSRGTEWMLVEKKEDVEKVVSFIETSMKNQSLEQIAKN